MAGTADRAERRGVTALADPEVRQFRERMLPIIVEQFNPERVLLFGSRARGDALRESDLDVIIVSASFDGTAWIERPAMVLRAMPTQAAPIEVLCYTPEEFARKREQLGIVRAAVEDGVDLL